METIPDGRSVHLRCRCLLLATAADILLADHLTEHVQFIIAQFVPASSMATASATGR